ncbi:glycosyltransferase [Ancylobacter sp. 6x-1]|uniref:Glycosyltransferase n=1 Tax=Ancylobacter crimeensis TaxID=2579147 RepID=A0ABT0D772_9HYPH|nr:glycosyltransferase [Ancylobacter crimeensis]MCK0195795.1 glycosyltransferase [Ancylobacter crimeensis]
MTRNKIAVYFYGAFSPEADGCHARVCSLLDRLVLSFPRVVVYSYDNHPDFPWKERNIQAFHQRWPGVELVLEHYSGRLKLATRVKNLLISFFPGMARNLVKLSLPGASPKFAGVKAEAGSIFVNYTHGLAQLNGVDPDRCVVDTHDVNFAKWAKLARASSVSLTSLRKLRGEIAVLQIVYALVAISPSEAAFFRMMLEDDRVHYVAAWDPPRKRADVAPASERDIDLVFFGSAYAMNGRGLVQMFAQNGEWLARYRIAICGNVCNDPDVVALAGRHANVRLLGYVDRPEEIYARSKAALSPVDGTGLKMKIVGALRAGVPAFVSRSALDGLPSGYEEAVFPLAEAEVARVLGDDRRLADAQNAAFAYYAQFDRGSDAAALIERLARKDERALTIRTDAPARPVFDETGSLGKLTS